MNIPPSVKSGGKFAGAVLLTLVGLALFKKHVLPRLPLAVQKVFAVVPL